jgi:hypothetical protein
MTQEAKDILFKDLSMRLPYGVKILFGLNDEGGTDGNIVPMGSLIDYVATHSHKPILRPLSDLSDQQLYKMGYDLCLISIDQIKSCIEDIQQGNIEHVHFMHLIENHYDVSLLIERGIAVDVNTLETDPYK